MKRLLVVAVLLVAGCSSETQEAEDQYNFLAKAGSPEDRCQAASKVADAYLKAKDQAGYSAWKINEDRDCHARSDMEPDNMELP